MTHRMHIDMANDKLYDIHSPVKITAVRDMPEFDVKEGEQYDAEVWVYGDRTVFVQRLSDGKILRDER